MLFRVCGLTFVSFSSGPALSLTTVNLLEHSPHSMNCPTALRVSGGGLVALTPGVPTRLGSAEESIRALSRSSESIEPARLPRLRFLSGAGEALALESVS